jgi:metal-responsive CopG/Arc/MetJ family transcriptional regulator
MKTAISIPDKLFRVAERTAKQLGIPRSQLFSIALEEYVSHHNQDIITEKLNAIYKINENNLVQKEIGLDSLRKATENDSW